MLRLTTGEKTLIDRRRRGLTQAQLASKMGLDVWDIAALERGAWTHRLAPRLGRLRPHERCLILRRRAKLTQADVAERMGCSRYWVNQMEKGVNPSDLIGYWSS